MLNNRGIARAVVLLTIIAMALVTAIAVSVAVSKTQQMAREMDDLYVKAAEDEAYLKWVQGDGSFNAIYDSEKKRFIDIGTAMPKVVPYGTSREHKGMVIYVSVDENGNIYTKWADQGD